ncbi:hypothetical protein QWY28_15470 [Nocardioides sp. SOB77]|uniref:Secreted protein n=1 Tax=Nocardioides oceani TaxID=3058369 RepID=A0ABT8FI46_9ACTN|nr:hypothetical protein [Nocardioides oceani]MDN4174363.1 hypothetical protein [Nocardioides oceani]
MTPRPVAYAAPVLALALLAGGCSGDDPATPTDGPAPTSSAPTSAATSSDSSTPSDRATTTPAAPSRLVAEDPGSSVACVQRFRAGDRLSIYDPILVAEGDVTITGIDVVPNTGLLRFLPRQQVVTVTADPAFGPGIAYGDDWPIERNAELREKTEWADRGPLVGREVADGERILPLLGLRAAPQARGDLVLEGIDVHYRSAGGDAGTARAEIGTRLTPGRC